MQSQDIDVLRQLNTWYSLGESPWLCTIVAADGSSPRPVGSMMVCTPDGRQAGSISGGCVEEDLLQRLMAGELDSTLPQKVQYGVSAEENSRLGLPCGGRLTLLVQRLAPGQGDWLPGALTAVENRRCLIRTLDLDTGFSTLHPTEHFEPLALDQKQLRQCFGPRMRMLLVGAGQLAQSLSELAIAMDYEVLVTDPRKDRIEDWRGPAVTLLQGMPDDVVREHACDHHAIVITLTHDPRIDDMALMEALGTQAWYVGALGSARTTEKRLDRLRQLELPESQIARLHAPVGLPIGSKTPIEIAVAIMGQLTQLRRKRRDMETGVTGP